MQNTITKHKRRNLAAHSETDIKNSWYWSVLIKNEGSLQKAYDSWNESRKKADLFYNLGLKIRI